ncbi:WhiB family transcriptional regulator [Streptomyces sp. P17]|uniref:WhiB family transcriptional regulator n=1 Tax=Streptomyces sp. P17 TaxID=3074716 RepID=UPI0028F3E509|nr:WhiB family transcriptional regulator [Streptomyces sp. P17]MDT9698165.1 WhiB family transcriptional regulator [Streptomyces sp. P17]
MHAPPHYADPDPWTERAACRDTDPETFFPLPGASGGVDREAVAKRLCGRCPVARECLREALLRDEGAGIWGGFNARERRELLRIASTLESTAAELAGYLASGGRRLSATPRERPAYVWYLRRHGWTPRRIAGALGVSFGQVQQAWQLAELAASCTRGPVSGMPNPRAPRKRVRRTGGDERGVVGVERPEIRGGVAALGRTPLPGYGNRGAAPKRPQLPAGGGHPAGPVPADRRRVPLAGDGRGVGGGRTQVPLPADRRGVRGGRTQVPLAADRRGVGGGRTPVPLPADRRGVGGGRTPVPLPADRRGVGGGRTQVPLPADRRGVGGGRTQVPLAADRRGAGSTQVPLAADGQGVGGSRSPEPLGSRGRRVQGGERVPERSQVAPGAGPLARDRERVPFTAVPPRGPGPVPADRTRVRLAPMARRLPTGPRVTLTSSSARTFVAPGSPRITITIRPVPGTVVSRRGVS